jgi:hypothetical protein
LVICQVKKFTFEKKKSRENTETIFMKPQFWSNLDSARQKVKKERKAIIEECDLAPNAFTQGIKRKSTPAADTALKCAIAVNSTVEQLVDGEAGAEYVRQWARQDGKVWQAPEAIADIVDLLGRLDEGELVIVRGTIMAILRVNGLEENIRGGLPPLKRAEG